MQIAQILSGYSLGDADLLRRAMGKKDKKVMAEQKSRFLDGARANGVDEDKADRIFELVNKFAGYGFNKSHAAAYAMIAYQTAFIKAKYPPEFMAALMSLDIANTDKLAVFHQEAKRLGVEVVAPDINVSFADFEVRGGKILYALGALKNVGLSAMQHVVDIRNEGGPFKDMFDFARRVSAGVVGKRAIENLARAGAFDSLVSNRAKVLAAAGMLQQIGSRAADERASAQVSLFGDAPDIMAEPEMPDMPPWAVSDQLDEELSAIGFYFSGHPLEQFSSGFERRKIVMSHEIAPKLVGGASTLRLCGIVKKRQERVSQRNNSRFAYVALSDPGGMYEAFVGADLLTRCRDMLNTGDMVEITAKVEESNGELKIFSEAIQPLETALTNGAKGFKVYLTGADAIIPFHETLNSLSGTPSKRRGVMHIIVPVDDDKEAEFKLPNSFPLDGAFRGALKSAPGVELIEEI